MRASRRVQRLPPYPFVELAKKASLLREKGELIDLSLGDPDLGPPRVVSEALVKALVEEDYHRYPPHDSLLELRRAFAAWFECRFGLKLDPEGEVLVLIGSKEGIAHLPLALLDPGDSALVPEPAYPVYRNACSLADARAITVPLLEENSFLPDLRALDARGAKLMFLNYPNNPTASVATEEFLREARDFAEDNGLIVCYDNAYSEITFDGFIAPSFFEVRGAKDIGIEFHSLSKTYSMQGFRVGFAVGSEELLEPLRRLKETIDSGIFVPIQRAAIVALQENPKGVTKVYGERRDYFYDVLIDMGFELRKPKGTFYLWVKVPGNHTSIEFCEMLLERCRILVAPGTGFGELGEGYFRVSLTQPLSTLEKAAELLRRL